MRINLFAGIVMLLLALYVFLVLAERMQDGRCKVGGRSGGLDCTYAKSR